MNIPGQQVKSRRRVGTVGGRGVWQVDLIGGLHLIAAERAGGDLEIAGMSSHPLMARHIAKRHLGDVKYTDLMKAERVDPRDFGDLLPHWDAETDRLRAAWGARTR